MRYIRNAYVCKVCKQIHVTLKVSYTDTCVIPPPPLYPPHCTSVHMRKALLNHDYWFPMIHQHLLIPVMGQICICI